MFRLLIMAILLIGAFDLANYLKLQHNDLTIGTFVISKGLIDTVLDIIEHISLPGAIAILAYIVIEHAIRNAFELISPSFFSFIEDKMMPKCGVFVMDRFFPKVVNIVGDGANLCRNDMKTFLLDIERIIESKPLLFGSLDEKYTSMRNESYLDRMVVRDEDVAELNKAKAAFASGDVDKGLKILSSLVNKKPGYKEVLLNGLVLSKHETDWRHAEKLLDEGLGNSIHYNKLSYAFWANNNFEKALLLAEKAKDMWNNENKHDNDKYVLGKIYNNLAYYYASIDWKNKNITNKDMALKFSKSSFDIKKEKIDELNTNGTKDIEKEEMYKYDYALSMDTLGFVKIVYGEKKDDIEEGLTLCEDARRLGAPLDVYINNQKVAESRLARFY